jgi:hypothetical protein
VCGEIAWSHDIALRHCLFEAPSRTGRRSITGRSMMGTCWTHGDTSARPEMHDQWGAPNSSKFPKQSHFVYTVFQHSPYWCYRTLLLPYVGNCLKFLFLFWVSFKIKRSKIIKLLSFYDMTNRSLSKSPIFGLQVFGGSPSMGNRPMVGSVPKEDKHINIRASSGIWIDRATTAIGLLILLISSKIMLNVITCTMLLL